jgi:hypothetical protein
MSPAFAQAPALVRPESEPLGNHIGDLPELLCLKLRELLDGIPVKLWAHSCHSS